MKLVISAVVCICCLLTSACAPSRTQLLSDQVNKGLLGGKLTRSVKGGTRNSLITELYTSGKCGAVSRGGFIWMTDKVVVADLLAPLGAEQVSQLLSKVNFDSQGVLMVDFGTTPTPAHRVDLLENKLQLNGPKAIVRVDLVKPAGNGKRMPQVVSHPCAVYSLPRLGFTVLEIQSGLGDVFTTFSN